MSERPLVSVIMAAYNAEQYLRAALESILSQDFRDLELLVVEDGSTDGTRAILEDCQDSRLRVLANPGNLGLTASLNRGLAAARGRYFARQDADDISLPGRLAQQVTFMESYPDVGLLGTAYEIIDLQEQLLDRARPPLDNETLQLNLLRSNPFCHGSTLLRRECIEGTGGYRPEAGSAEDYDLWLRTAEDWQLANLGDCLYRYRFNPHGVSLQNLERQFYFARAVRQQALVRRGLLQSATADDHAGAADELSSEEQAQLLERILAAIPWLYRAGACQQAASLLRRARDIAGTGNAGHNQIQGWMLDTARAIAAQSGLETEGARFLAWALHESVSRNDRRRVLGDFYMGAAFNHYARHEYGRAQSCVWRGVWYSPHWLSNLGVLSIVVRTTLQTRGARTHMGSKPETFR